MKFDIICADPPWSFSDYLSMEEVKRGAAANYRVMSNQNILDLKVKELAADNAVLALWVPSSLLSIGLEVMNQWGFKQTQTLSWIKVKKDIWSNLRKSLLEEFKTKSITPSALDKCLVKFKLNEVLSFGMGRLFRQCHELVLIGTRGKIYNSLKNKSQRSVVFNFNTKHSQKPDELQDRLELMFPNSNKLEMFARRKKDNWICVGLECPETLGEDITDSLTRLSKL